ncbi:helix-turn-helix domain-containing protein [Lactobacillus delbrueckii subsp. lactis]|uniref:helix-turn-helix transcriptional regulator n=1 Tax=Lactobacillus delbrueckii TaxID=1584 RepID=UPI001E510865|nr:helix-turn-helix transcriptional regulator [Lactobacillus delbrueckii]MCD5569630.1 helix-turn-helix domain-containing protein [Lactobacillus delbrueckii subsp. lactis]
MNRIKELRKANHMTQAELAKKLGVTPQAVGAYERGDRGVNRETLEKLSEIFGRSAGYIAGEPSEDNVIRYLMDYYNEKDRDRIFWQARSLPWSLWGKLENYFIGNGIVPYNIPSTTRLLSEDQATDFDFWKKQFSWLIDGESYKYLKDSCEAVPESTFAAMLATVIAASYESELLPNVHYKSKENKEWVDEDSEFRQRLVKRQKFLQSNAVQSKEPDFIDPYGQPFYGWRYTWQLGLPVVEIE